MSTLSTTNLKNPSSGSNNIVLNADGNIGVGTTQIVAPNTGGSLTASGTLAVRGYLSDHQTNAGVLQYNDNVLALRAYGATAGTGVIAFNTGGGGNTTDTERLRITSAGNVGIGTTSPVARLDVVGGINGAITAGTAVASTSGTAIDFTGLPSWVKRVTVMFNGVSTNGTSNLIVQLGAGSVTTSGYTSGAVSARATAASGPITTSTSGILSYTDFAASADLASGFVQIFNVSANNWLGTAVTGNSVGTRTTTGTGTITLSGTLDRIRITTVNGTDTFDAGSINILWEG